MKRVYPAIFTKVEEGYIVSVPDFPLDTQGDSLTDAIYMARDAIGLLGLSLQDDGMPIPIPSDNVDHLLEDGDFVSMVDIDFEKYRKENDLKSVRRNVSLPHWLDALATKDGLNVSLVLQDALKVKLGLDS